PQLVEQLFDRTGRRMIRGQRADQTPIKLQFSSSFGNPCRALTVSSAVIAFSLCMATASVAIAEPLTLENAVAEALVKTRGVIHAKADLLLADVEQMKALALILPHFDLSLAAAENFRGSPILEARRGTQFTPL